MPRSENRKTLASVVLRLRQIATNQYDGKLYDNVLAIFNQLTTVEKRVLLRGLMSILMIVSEDILKREEETRDRYEISPAAREPATPVKKKSKLATVGTYVGTGLLISILFSAMFGSFVITGENGILARVEHFISTIKNAF